jgi:UV DNA damage endonuclease
MYIGYPCSNLSLRASASKTFRLASYSEDRLIETIEANLTALQRYLEWNVEHDIHFFRISSGTIPFASHPVMTFDWRTHFSDRFAEIGQFIAAHAIRINVHPGQYTLLNSPRPEVAEQSVAELVYHAELLDLLGLDHTHKVQIHVGGVYGDKPAAIARFVEAHVQLPEPVRSRLVIENDERQYNLADTMRIHAATDVPVLFDVLHHRLYNEGESLPEAFATVIPTWEGHGLPMIDYSSQDPTKQRGAHTATIDLDDFATVLDAMDDREVALMLEIKDKETSALKAIALVREHSLAAIS